MKNKVYRNLPQIRINQLTLLLDDLLGFEHPADAVLSRWMRNNKKAGPRDRAQVADAAYDVLRNLRLYRNFAESGTGAQNRRLSLLALNATLGVDYLKPAIETNEYEWLKQINNIDTNSLTEKIRYSLPDWLYENLEKLPNHSDLIEELNNNASLDIRVNPLKANRDDVLKQLLEYKDAATFKPQATPYSPWGIRLQGRPRLNNWDLFKKGLIEVQDEGSQILAALVAPKRGQMVIDYCAGAGGKTLLLGALMRSTGRLYAFDVSQSRLERAKPRFARSGLSNVITVAINETNDKRVKRLHGKADRVLVDAPCTGVGTLRRNPDLKWRMTPENLASLLQQQAEILRQASRCVKSGGRLIYATCSLLPQENQDQINAFLQENSNFKLLNAGTVLDYRCPNLVFDDEFLQLRPDTHATDGFFAAVLEKV